MTGAKKDLRKATKLAFAQVRQFGMSSRVGHLSFDVGEPFSISTGRGGSRRGQRGGRGGGESGGGPGGEESPGPGGGGEGEGPRFPMMTLAGKKPFSSRLESPMELEARRLVRRAFSSASTILREQRERLDTLAAELLAKEVLNADDITRILGPSPHGPKRLAEFAPVIREESSSESPSDHNEAQHT